jgi:hypothetical protein
LKFGFKLSEESFVSQSLRKEHDVKYSAKSDKNGVSAASFLLVEVILKTLKGVVSGINFNGWLFLLPLKNGPCNQEY